MAGAGINHCLGLMVECPESLEVGQLSSDIIAHLIQEEKYAKTVLKLVFPANTATPVNHIKLLLEKVQRYFAGTLKLRLRHSYDNFLPCDDIINVLTGEE